MAELGYDWVAVCDGDDRLQGWIGGAELDGAATIGELTPKPFLSVVTAGTTLKAALDGIVTSRTRVAMAVDDDGRYLGMLTVDDLAEGVTA
jgi:CBS domain-containing protein